MDMSRHLPRWLNETTLRDLGDTYEGRIADVREEKIRNKFRLQKALEPVIHFEDGFKLCPNIGQRRALISFWGAETSAWIGRRLVVSPTLSSAWTGKAS